MKIENVNKERVVMQGGYWRHLCSSSLGVMFGIALLLGTLIFGGACGDQASPAETEALGVVVTIPPLAEFVEQVGGEHVAVTIMVPPGADPHSYAPTHTQLQQVSKAEVYVKVGSGVEFEKAHMDELIEQNKDMLIVDCSEGIQLLAGAHDQEHEGADPHIWTSPVNAKKMVENICEGLIEADPDHAEDYRSNRDDYLQELDGLDTYIHSLLDEGEERHFMIYHPSLGYFAAEYNLEQLAVEHGGKAPTASVINECIALAQEHSLDYVFVEPQFATEQAETVAKAIGGRTALVDPLGCNYLASMRAIAEMLALEIE